jgi:hypothetical protein
VDNAVTSEDARPIHISELLGRLLDEIERRGTTTTFIRWLSDEWLWDAERPDFRSMSYAEYLQTEHWQTTAQDVVMAYNHGLRGNRLDERIPDDYLNHAKRSTKGKPQTKRPPVEGADKLSVRSPKVPRREAGRSKAQPPLGNL